MTTPPCDFGRLLVKCKRPAKFHAVQSRWLCDRHIVLRRVLDEEQRLATLSRETVSARG